MALTDGFQLPFGIQPLNPVPTDSWSGPYEGADAATAKAAANAAIPAGVRFKSLEVRLIVNGSAVKYWYKDGTADGNLIEFAGASGGTTTDDSKLPLTGGTLTGGLTGTTGVFTTSLSAPALSGTHYGDGSNLTNITASGGTATDSSKLPLTGGTINGNLTVVGNLTATGTTTFANTTFSTTSALVITNTSPVSGVPALYVGQSGPSDIASFYDLDQNVEVLHIGGVNSIYPNVGIKTSTPNKTLTVVGEISTTGDIFTSGKFSGDGSNLTSVVASGGTATDTTKLPLSGGTLTGGLTGTVGVFAVSLSAPALSGTFYGDGSKLTGVVASGGTVTDSTKLALSGGTLTGGLTGTVGVFTTSLSAPALSGTHYGDASNLANIPNIFDQTLNTSSNVKFNQIETSKVFGGNYGANVLELPLGYGPILAGYAEGNVFIQTGQSIPSEYLSWKFNHSDRSLTLPASGIIQTIDGSTISFNSNISALALSGTFYGDGAALSNVVHTQYTLTTASDTILGGVKVDGSSITISNGVISASAYSPPANATFTSSVSAPALSGTFYGDGSKLTSVIASGGTATDSTKLALSGGTLTGGLTGTLGVFTTSLSAPALSGTFYGDGSKLTGVVASGGTATDSTKLALTGGTVNGNLTVVGNLTATGTTTFANTTFSTTSALVITNTSPVSGVPALYVGQSGPSDIASFYDLDQNVEVLHIGGVNSIYPNVGIKTSTPNKTFTVSGEISASGDISTSGFYYGDGSNLTGVIHTQYTLTTASNVTLGGVKVDGSSITISNGVISASAYNPPANATFTASVSAPALSGTFYGDGTALTGVLHSLPAVGTFTTSVSAPALSGTHYGDGSKLTGITANDSTKLPLSGGTLTGGLTATNISTSGSYYGDGSKLTGVQVTGGTFTSSISAPSLSSTFYGDGSNITNLLNGAVLQTYQTDYSTSIWTAKDFNRIWNGIAVSSDASKQTAVVNGGQIYISVDSGNIWTATDSNRNWSGVEMSSDGSKQTAVVNGGQIYISTNFGVTWSPVDSNRNWSGVAVSPGGTTQTAVVSGGQIYVSVDSGITWTAKDSNRNWSSVATSSDGSIQIAAEYGGQLYVSTDTGNNWAPVETNRNWNSVAISSDGATQTAVVNGGQIYVSTDFGVTWNATDSARSWDSVAMSSDGSKQTAVVNGGQIYVSVDYGATWNVAKDSVRQWVGIAMSSDAIKQTAIVNSGQIYINAQITPTVTSTNMATQGQIQYLSGSTVKAYQYYNTITNSLDTIFT